jgi:hypothetical protein
VKCLWEEYRWLRRGNLPLREGVMRRRKGRGDEPTTTHQQLWNVCRDKEAYESGLAYHYDCSAQCYWYHELLGQRGQDWGICTNPKSPRAGLPTFEHMGCQYYESSFHPMGFNLTYQREMKGST